MNYPEQYQQLSDSIYEDSNVEKATQIAAEYEFRRQVAEMEEERKETEKKLTDEIEAESFENRLVLLAPVPFILLALTLARSYYLIQKQNQKLKSDKNLAKYVELLGASSDRMRNMIDRVLDISAIENMKVNLKLERADLISLTYESIRNFDIIASQKDIGIIDNIDKLNTCFSEVDPNYLAQVIDNLLSNVIKFSARGKQIEVSLISENSHHEIIVKDQGPGISEEEQKNLFQAYTTHCPLPKSLWML